MGMGELALRHSAEFHAGMHKDAVEKEQDWTMANGVGEEPEKLQHGGHVASGGVE